MVSGYFDPLSAVLASLAIPPGERFFARGRLVVLPGQQRAFTRLQPWVKTEILHLSCMKDLCFYPLSDCVRYRPPFCVVCLFATPLCTARKLARHSVVAGFVSLART